MEGKGLVRFDMLREDNAYSLPVTFLSGDITLEGILSTPRTTGPFPGVVVCHPHPMYGGDMDNYVVMAMCLGLTEHGLAALRFNFRDVGHSRGVHSRGEGERHDVRAALAFLRGSEVIDSGRIGLAGYSFGASVALATAPSDNELCAVAGVAPPTPGLNTLEIMGYTKPKFILAGDLESITEALVKEEQARKLQEAVT